MAFFFSLHIYSLHILVELGLGSAWAVNNYLMCVKVETGYSMQFKHVLLK